jgi:chromosome segregation ATPase
MSEQDEHVTVIQDEGGSNALKWIFLLLAAIYVAASLYFLIDLRGRVAKLANDQTASQKQVADLTTRMQAAEAEAETLGQQVGITKKELAQRAQQLQAAQRAAEERLAKEQKEQITAVSGDIAGVKTDVGGVKTDVAQTKTDLAATKAKLESTVGDLGLQSGLIAKTRDDLEVLKHRGDRNYYEFTLLKGAKPQPVSTVSLQIKKIDQKRGKYTLNVTSDDKTIEKKDRNVNEPIQFYTGRDHMLYELVVWTLDKNKASGYVSTPKGAPVPVTASPSPGGTQ